MAKGTLAKEKVKAAIKKALGTDFVGEYDGKLYAWADDGSGRIQVSIALTCPKVYRGVEETTSHEMYFDEDLDPTPTSPSGFTPADITQEEQDTLAELMNRLGL